MADTAKAAAATKAADTSKAADTKPATRRPSERIGRLTAEALLEFAHLGRLTDETTAALREVVEPESKTDQEVDS